MNEEKPSTYTDGESSVNLPRPPTLHHEPSLVLESEMLLGSTASNVAGSSPNRVLHTISNRVQLIGVHDVTSRRVTRLGVA